MFFETPISRESGISPSATDEPTRKIQWPENTCMELMLRCIVSGQIHKRCACGNVLALASSDVIRCRQVLLSTWFPYLVPRSAAFGVFWVQQPFLPRVSTRFF